MNSFLKDQLLKLLPVFLLLVLIPLLLIKEQIGFAKFSGFILIVYMSLLVMYWRKGMIKENVRRKRIRISTNERFWLERNVKVYQFASKEDRLIFEDQIGLIIANIILKDENNNVPDKEKYLAFASFLYLKEGCLDWNSWVGREIRFDFSNETSQKNEFGSYSDIKSRLSL
jgi:hypothetical protein